MISSAWDMGRGGNGGTNETLWKLRDLQSGSDEEAMARTDPGRMPASTPHRPPPATTDIPGGAVTASDTEGQLRIPRAGPLDCIASRARPLHAALVAALRGRAVCGSPVSASGRALPR